MTPAPISTPRFVCWFIVWSLGCFLFMTGEQLTAIWGMWLAIGSDIILTSWKEMRGEMNRPVAITGRQKIIGLLGLMAMVCVFFALGRWFPGYGDPGGAVDRASRHPALVIPLWAFVTWCRWLRCKGSSDKCLNVGGPPSGA